MPWEVGGVLGMLRAVLLALLAGVVLAVPAHAREQHFTAEPNGQISFVMPSGNIGCLYTPRGGTRAPPPGGPGAPAGGPAAAPAAAGPAAGPPGATGAAAPRRAPGAPAR